MFIRALGLVAAASCLAVPAIAAEPAGQSVRVVYKDLDLETAEGQASLARRLDAAARQVCGMDEMQTGTRIGNRDAQRCYRETRASLQAQFTNVFEGDRAG